MSKFFKLKEWFTVSDTARHLSLSFGEQVTDSDVLRLALDGRLKLSVNFVNEIVVRPGKIVAIHEATYEEVLGLHGDPVRLYEGPRIFTNAEQTHVLELEKRIQKASGVYDLPMIGAERLDIERAYQNLTTGPDVKMVAFDGAFIDAGSGVICQIQEDSEREESLIGSKAREERNRKAYEKSGSLRSFESYAKQLDDRAEFLERRSKQAEYQRYFPAGGLPDDHVIVVRSAALQALLKSANDAADTNESKPLIARERDTLLTIIAALCNEAKIPYEKPSKAAGLIQSTAAKMGVSIGETTIEGHLKKIPDALGTRMK